MSGEHARLEELARERPRFGYRRLGVLLRREGHVDPPTKRPKRLRVRQRSGLAVLEELLDQVRHADQERDLLADTLREVRTLVDAAMKADASNG